MTADDIIAANPTIKFRHALIGDMEGLIGTCLNGVELWTIWANDQRVDGAMPWTLATVQIAKRQLMTDSAITMRVPPVAATATPGPLVRTEGESDERYAERSALFDRLFAIPDQETEA